MHCQPGRKSREYPSPPRPQENSRQPWTAIHDGWIKARTRGILLAITAFAAKKQDGCAKDKREVKLDESHPRPSGKPGSGFAEISGIRAGFLRVFRSRAKRSHLAGPGNAFRTGPARICTASGGLPPALLNTPIHRPCRPGRACVFFRKLPPPLFKPGNLRYNKKHKKKSRM